MNYSKRVLSMAGDAVLSVVAHAFVAILLYGKVGRSYRLAIGGRRRS